MKSLALVMMLGVVPGLALAGGAERTERQHARKEAAQVELLQRAPTRPGVAHAAVDAYLWRYGHLDTRPVRRIESWGATLPRPEPVVTAPPPAPSEPDATMLAIPFEAPAEPAAEPKTGP